MSASGSLHIQLDNSEERCNWCQHSTTPSQLLKKYEDRTGTKFDDGRTVIQQLIDSYHSPVLIMLDDAQTYYDDEECLKRMYAANEYQGKIRMLSQYYKFHNEVPRLFMLSFMDTLDSYVDERRQLQYVKVTNILKKDANQVKKPQEGPIKKLLDSIDVSYEDFQRKNEKKKDQKGKNKKIIRQKRNNFCIQSTDGHVTKNSKPSSKKKSITPTVNDHNKSTKGLSRQKSKCNLQNVYSRVGLKPIADRQEFKSNEKKQLKITTSKNKGNTTTREQQPQKSLARMRCGSKGMLKISTVPLKTIDMNKLANTCKQQTQSRKNLNLEDLSKIQKKPEERPRIASTSRDRQKVRSKCSQSSSTAQLQQSHGSTANLLASKGSTRKNLQNVFSGLLGLKKARHNL